jgi:cytochrome c-type biogenesis protein CcmF
VIFEGQNEKGWPIIKAHLNPMVIWIWIGAWVMVLGTGMALIPNAPAPARVPVTKRVAEPVHAVTGD